MIIQCGIQFGGLQFGEQVGSSGGDGFVLFGVDYVYYYLLWCYCVGLDNVGVIVVLFDGGGDDV